MAHIAFLTLYLGLVSGQQPMELTADPMVVALRMELDGRVVATLKGPPWSTSVDFGQALMPQELVAIGLDAGGAEVGRASQIINLPRPASQVEILLQHDAAGVPVGATVVWRHLAGQKPQRVRLTLDDKVLRLRDASAELPRLDFSLPHVLAAEVQFLNESARNEIVLGGTNPDSTGTQLTATAVVETGSVPPSLDGCFALDGHPIRAQAIETGEALVVLVPDVEMQSTRLTGVLDADTALRLMWPVANRVTIPNQASSTLFPYTTDLNRDSRDMSKFLSYSHDFRRGKQQLADAVAVAGVTAMSGARRRAVVLAVGRTPDQSVRDAQTVRHYLASIGVPLFVWSFTRPTPELTTAWGDVLDVSTPAGAMLAEESLRQTLAAQRIVWLSADPVRAIRATVKASCGLARMAR
jgi:hypothetical protein